MKGIQKEGPKDRSGYCPVKLIDHPFSEIIPSCFLFLSFYQKLSDEPLIWIITWDHWLNIQRTIVGIWTVLNVDGPLIISVWFKFKLSLTTHRYQKGRTKRGKSTVVRQRLTHFNSAQNLNESIYTAPKIDGTSKVDGPTESCRWGKQTIRCMQVRLQTVFFYLVGQSTFPQESWAKTVYLTSTQSIHCAFVTGTCINHHPVY